MSISRTQQMQGRVKRLADHDYHDFLKQPPPSLNYAKTSLPKRRFTTLETAKSSEVDVGVVRQGCFSRNASLKDLEADDWVVFGSHSKTEQIVEAIGMKAGRVVQRRSSSDIGRHDDAKGLHETKYATELIERNLNSDPHAKYQGKRRCKPSEAECSGENKLPLSNLGRSKQLLQKEVTATRAFKLGSVVDAALASTEEHLASRKKVYEVLKQFEKLYQMFLKERNSERKENRPVTHRVDIKAAMVLKDEQKWINAAEAIGSVPGIEIGDKFQLRVELAIVGIHRDIYAGIRCVKFSEVLLATSIVSSGDYENEILSSDEFVYTGEGSNPKFTRKEPTDQKLVRGNLALKNNMDFKHPVRVTFSRRTLQASSTMGMNNGSGVAFTYDGLYMVKKYWMARDDTSGKLVFKFKLQRLPGQLYPTDPSSGQSKISAERWEVRKHMIRC